MRFVCKAVPKLVEKHSYDPTVGPRTPEQRYEMTKEMGSKLTKDQRGLKGMPVGLNHRPGPPAGKVLKAFIDEDDALCYMGDIDESEPLGAVVASQIRDGLLNNVSLTHLPRDNPINIELTLCTLKGARPGSGIIRIWDETKDPPVAEEDNNTNDNDDFRREREYYLEKRELVMASDEFASIQVPSFNDPTQTTTLVTTMSTVADPSPPPASEAPPATSAPPPPADVEADQQSQQRRQGDLIEDKCAMWEKGLRPDDAREGDTYETYLFRMIGDGSNVITHAMRDRIMRLHLDKLDESQKQRKQHEDLSRGLINVVAPLVRKFGARANPPVSEKDLLDADNGRDAGRLQQYLTQMQAVMASEEMSTTSAHERMLRDRAALLEREEKMMETRRRFNAEDEARQARERNRFETSRMADQIYERTMQNNKKSYHDPPPSTLPSPPPPPQADPYGMDDLSEHTRRLKLLQSQRSLIDELRNPSNNIGSVDKDMEKRILAMLESGDGLAPVRSTQEYFKKHNFDPTYTPAEASFKAPYMPGIVAASEEFIAQTYDPVTARHLNSDFNANLDKAVIPYMVERLRSSSRDPLELNQFLRSYNNIPVERNRRSGEITQWGSTTMNPASLRSTHCGTRQVNGWKNAQSSRLKALTAKAERERRR